MIEIVSGLPGSGKSQLVVEELFKSVDTRERPVFVDIAGLDHDKLKTFQLQDPIGWDSLPEGSLIIMDECQRHFPPRPAGSKVPAALSALETHRHKGYDIVFITQHPSLLDQHIRKLTERHRHCVRPLGMKYRKVYDWPTVNENPTPKQSTATAGFSLVKFNPDVYQFYKSASTHTDKRRFPKKQLAIVSGAFLMVVLSLFFVYTQFQQKMFHADSVVQDAIPEAQTEAPKTESYSLSSLPVLPSAETEPDDSAELLVNQVIGFLRPSDLSSVYVRYLGETLSLTDFYTYSLEGFTVSAVPYPDAQPIAFSFPPDLLFQFKRQT